MHTLKNVIENSGGTYNQDGTIATHKEGYYIGGIDERVMELEWIDRIPEGFSVKSMIEFYLPNIGSYHYPAQDSDSYQLAGFWVDGNKLYIERVKHTYNLSYALACGKANKQICIWDIANQETIAITEQHK